MRPRIIVVLLIVVGCFGAMSAGFVAARALPTVQDIGERLTCQCGCGLTVANCNHPQCEFSVPVREQIEKMIAKGTSGADIVAFFRAKYGEKILSAPTAQGFNLLAWTMPFIALIAGCGIIVVAISRWHRGPEAEPAVVDVPAVDPELKRRLERELRERR